MKILVINCGSSSIKYQLLDADSESVLAKGLLERIGISGSKLTHKRGGEKFEFIRDIADHTEGLVLIIDALQDEKTGVVKNINEIEAVGHRVVHGGERFASSVLLDDEVIREIEANNFLAPLHNPANIEGIIAAKKILPLVPHIGVFDTAFHQSMTETSYLYAIPYSLYRKYKIRRYGFHGTSHRYVANRVASILGKPIKELKIITAHIGNGASVAAVKYGRSVDTSMGFTPLEGLVMGTRSGDVDPAIVPFLQEQEGLTAGEVNNLLNKESGMFGLTDRQFVDMRDIEERAAKKDPLCMRAHSIYEYRLAKYIGAYAAAMNGVDAIAFTAGVGENSPFLRENVVNKYLNYLGIELDREKNNCKGCETMISTPQSKVKVMVVPTNEELVIARDTSEIVKKGLKELKLWED
ncbi:MAG: acetate kinase [Thermotogaceae bacterium]|jgi:acetate kinase|nr:acetate kinase [Mesotoga sp.]NLX33593.1 acetate kinase [Thermotogaceae bacterium]MDD4039634.1 acetate kinase [Mesotoga sp.]MDD4477784.1 acetate kinase [Mesotoga sp.]HOY27206.1 acetate kinase [Mesotoga sp.]